eukprot:16304-Heterococcus_DN1.PRE.1
MCASAASCSVFADVIICSTYFVTPSPDDQHSAGLFNTAKPLLVSAVYVHMQTCTVSIAGEHTENCTTTYCNFS